jgi:hypothetical protein
MGVVIRKTAAAEEITRDVRTTLANAVARGGAWQALAQEALSDVLALLDANRKLSEEAAAAYLPLKAAVAARDEEADALLGRISDLVWNEVGRPRSDAAYATLFPGGIRYYTEGETESQPHRMELLALLLESKTHPKLAPESALEFAKALRVSAAALQAALDAASVPAARVHQLSQVGRAVATTAQVALASLKRRYKAEQFSEADIHAVIPDRSESAAKPPHSPAVPSS